MAVSALSLTFKFILASPYADSQSTYHRAEIHAHISDDTLEAEFSLCCSNAYMM